jgi:hypothetical protein
VEPQVKVNAPVVDAVTGKAPATPESQIETAAVLTLFYFFLAILVEGLLLAGSVSTYGSGFRTTLCVLNFGLCEYKLGCKVCQDDWFIGDNFDAAD